MLGDGGDLMVKEKFAGLVQAGRKKLIANLAR